MERMGCSIYILLNKLDPFFDHFFVRPLDRRLLMGDPKHDTPCAQVHAKPFRKSRSDPSSRCGTVVCPLKGSLVLCCPIKKPFNIPIPTEKRLRIA